MQDADAGRADAESLLTVAQVARRAGVTQTTIRNHIRKGALPHKRVGPFRRIRITSRACAEYIG